MIAGPAADWLEARREELNQRFERARRRCPALEPGRVLARLGEVLPPLAAAGGEVLSAVYDLVLLHAGRDAFATRPELDALVRRAFPRLVGLLGQRPSLVGALSNAVENLGARGAAYAAGIAEVGAHVTRPEELLDAGAVLAWRLGEPRLREAALRAAAGLPARAALTALGLRDWPDDTAAVALGALTRDAWRLPTPTGRVTAADKWTLAASVGEFAGFGGCFDAPPLLLAGGDRHALHVRSGGSHYRVEADVFGWSASPEPAPSIPPAPAAPPATSRLALPGLIAVTHADSHRIRILIPEAAA